MFFNKMSCMLMVSTKIVRKFLNMKAKAQYYIFQDKIEEKNIEKNTHQVFSRYNA